MRVVFYTRGAFERNELLRYMHARVAERYPDTHIVAVVRQRRRRRGTALKRYLRKARRLGFWSTLGIVTSYPIRMCFERRDRRTITGSLQALPRPDREIVPDEVTVVPSVNGPTAVRALTELAPDVIIQAGAGILRPPVFRTARIATLNVHHGIAPLIRGMASILWAQYERRPDWIGATVHVIDEGLDTGAVLAHAAVKPSFPGERFPSLYVRATVRAVDALIETLERLEAGETWRIEPASDESEYRSTFPGWKQLALEIRLALERRRSRAT